MVTCGGLWGLELQRVSQDVVVVPHVELIVSRVVAYRRDVLVRVGKSDAYGLCPFAAGVISVQDKVPTRLTVIILVDGANRIQDATGHERIRGHTFLKACLPCAFKTQCVRVHLHNTHKAEFTKTEFQSEHRTEGGKATLSNSQSHQMQVTLYK